MQPLETDDTGRADHETDARYRRLLAVTRSIAEKGYDAVSMRAVAKEAQMSLATIYQYVDSKDQLIAEAHAGGMRHFRDDIVGRPLVAPPQRTVSARSSRRSPRCSRRTRSGRGR